jgi:hypothetical protein
MRQLWIFCWIANKVKSKEKEEETTSRSLFTTIYLNAPNKPTTPVRGGCYFTP